MQKMTLSVQGRQARGFLVFSHILFSFHQRTMFVFLHKFEECVLFYFYSLKTSCFFIQWNSSSGCFHFCNIHSGENRVAKVNNWINKIIELCTLYLHNNSQKQTFPFLTSQFLQCIRLPQLSRIPYCDIKLSVANDTPKF